MDNNKYSKLISTDSIQQHSIFISIYVCMYVCICMFVYLFYCLLLFSFQKGRVNWFSFSYFPSYTNTNTDTHTTVTSINIQHWFGYVRDFNQPSLSMCVCRLLCLPCRLGLFYGDYLEILLLFRLIFIFCFLFFFSFWVYNNNSRNIHLFVYYPSAAESVFKRKIKESLPAVEWMAFVIKYWHLKNRKDHNKSRHCIICIIYFQDIFRGILKA